MVGRRPVTPGVAIRVPSLPSLFKPFLDLRRPERVLGPSLRSELVRFDEPTEGGGEAVGDMIAAAGCLELVDVEIHGDRGACVAHLPVHSDGVEAALGEAPPGLAGPGAHARPRARGRRPRYHTPLETLIEVGPGGRPPTACVRRARRRAPLLRAMRRRACGRCCAGGFRPSSS